MGSLTTDPVTAVMRNATPYMALADSSMGFYGSWADFTARSSIDGGYWDAGSGDGENPPFSEGSISNSFSWIGSDLEDEWQMKYLLGTPREVTKINIQFGDLYTHNNGLNPGVKKYEYDLDVLSDDGLGNKEWVTVASDVPNLDPELDWRDDMYSFSNSHLTFVNPRDGISPKNTGDGYVVADGTDSEVKVINGLTDFDIYGDDGFGFVDWKNDNKIVSSVAELPKQTGIFPSSGNYKGGYLIALTDGTLWNAEVGETRLDNTNEATESGGNFNEIDQIATYFTGTDYFDLYVLEKNGATSFTLYYYDAEITTSGILFSKNDYDSYINFSTSVGSIKAVNGGIMVIDQNTGNILIYNTDLSSQIGSITPSAGGFSVARDIIITEGGIGILDSGDDKIVGYDVINSRIIGEVDIEYNGVSPYILAGNMILSSSPNQYAKYIYWSDLRNNPVYFNWDTIEITENLISEYKITIHDFTTEWTWFDKIPPKVGVPVGSQDFSLEGWNRPIIVESLYEWEYDSEFDGIQVAIITPEDGENFATYGTQGTYDIEFDVKIAETDVYPDPYFGWLEGDPIPLQIDSVLRTIDGGSPTNVASFRSSKKEFLYSITPSGSVITTDFFAKATDVYRFKTDTKPIDGDIWDVYMDGDYILTYDEHFVEGSRDESSFLKENDLFAIYLSRGNHQIQFRNIGGSSKTLSQIYYNYDVWAQDGIPLSEDFHDMTIWVNDTNGFEDSDSVEFQIITFPLVNIISPGQDIGYNNNITLAFEVEDSNLDSVWYELNGVERQMLTYPENATGTNEIYYEEEIDVLDMIPNAVNQIQVTCNDTQGHLSFGYRTFFVDFEPPVIEFPKMVNNSYLPNNNTYYMNITDFTFLKAYYTINDNPVTFELNEGLNVVEIPSYEFSEGQNNFTVYAEDLVGNNATAYLNLSKDESYPVINITTPAEMDKFFLDATPDAIPLKVNAYDTIIDRSSPTVYGVQQLVADDYLRLHFGSYRSVSQSLIADNYSITDFSLRARGFGRLKITVFEDKFLVTTPISVGYIDVSDQINFNWYNAQMSQNRVQIGQRYYVKVESITLFNDLFISISNNKYPDGEMKINAIPRPQWDLTFKWGHKEVINNTETIELWYNVNGQPNSPIATNGSFNIADLRNEYTFSHGYNYINIFAQDLAQNSVTESVKIRYIDTTVNTPINVELTSQQELEWAYKNITVSWNANVPDHIDRVTFETYTHDIYLISVDLSTKVKVRTVTDVFQTEINTTLVPDGYYFIEINSTDGTTEDVDQSNLIRILNGAPIITITSPENGEYLNEESTVNISVICPDISDVLYRYDLGINNSIVEAGEFDFYTGYEFFITISPEEIADGIHSLDVFVKDSDNQTSNAVLLFIMDTTTDVKIDEMVIQSTVGYITITYDAPYDAEIVYLTIEDNDNVVIDVYFQGNNLTGEYIIEDGLPAADYLITITLIDRAGNEATDTEGFSVQQSQLADIIEDIFEFFGAILGLFALASGLATVMFFRRKKSACELYGGRFCEI